MHKVEELKVYQKAMDLVTQIYAVSRLLPDEERFGLVSQMRKCAVSIPSNIAEGAGRNSKKEFQYFLSIANGSSYELKTQLELCNRLEFIQESEISSLFISIDQIQKMIFSLSKNLNP